jgi:hypothetical protein
VKSNWPQLSLVAAAGVALLLGCILWRPLLVSFVWLVWLVVAATVVWRWFDRGPSAIVAGSALVFVLALAVQTAPGALHQVAARYRADSRFTSFESSEAFEQSDWGVDPSFVDYLAKHLPRGDTFYVATGKSIATPAPQQWLQFELLPSIEAYGSACSAKWIVFYAETQVPPGVRVEQRRTYRPGYGFGLVGSPCPS